MPHSQSPDPKRHRGQVFILHTFIFFTIFEIFPSSFLSFLILSINGRFSYFHFCYLYSNILLIVIPVKQVIEPGIAQTINLHPLRSSIPLFQKKRFHGTREYFHRFPQFCSPTMGSPTGLQQPLSPYNHDFWPQLAQKPNEHQQWCRVGTLVLSLLYINKRVINHDYILSLNSLDSPLVVEFIADFKSLLCCTKNNNPSDPKMSCHLSRTEWPVSSTAKYATSALASAIFFCLLPEHISFGLRPNSLPQPPKIYFWQDQQDFTGLFSLLSQFPDETEKNAISLRLKLFSTFCLRFSVLTFNFDTRRSEIDKKSDVFLYTIQVVHQLDFMDLW